MEKRTNYDFSKHIHIVEEYVCGDKSIRVDILKHPEYSKMHLVKFINTDENMIVTGDYGNWTFCRPFVPSKEGYVSDCYWLEKMRIYSEQVLGSYDAEETEKELNDEIEHGLEEYGYEGDELEKAKEFFTDLLDYVHDEIEYTYKAYRSYDKPNFMDYDEIPFCKKLNPRINIIFDAFDELCNRMKNDSI